MLPDRIPEYKRRAIRLAIGVGVPSYIGFALLGPEHHWSAPTICQWAAITAAIVAQPLIGKATQVGFERILGTVSGGLSGFLVHAVGRNQLFDEVGENATLHCKRLSAVVSHDSSLILFTFSSSPCESTHKRASLFAVH